MKSGIYEIRNIKTNQLYIGQSENVRKRLTAHLNRLRAGAHSNAPLQNAWNKYGHEAFEFTQIRTCTVERLTQEEQSCFDEYLNSGRWQQLYNIEKEAGPGTKHWQGKSRPDIAGSNHYLWGQDMPTSVRQKISRSKSGIPLTKEHKSKLKKANARFWEGKKRPEISDSNHHYFGKSRSEEVRQKISKALTGKYTGEKSPTYGRTVPEGERRRLCAANSKLPKDECLQIHKKFATGKFSQKKLASLYDVSRATMCNILNGNTWNHVWEIAQKKIYKD